MDNFYEVKDIIGSRFSRGQREYLVRWIGYDEDENSWEPETMLQEDCPELLKLYLSQSGSKPKVLAADRSLATPLWKELSGEANGEKHDVILHKSTPVISKTLSDSLEEHIERITMAHLKKASSLSDKYFLLQFVKETACLIVLFVFAFLIVPLLVPFFQTYQQ